MRQIIRSNALFFSLFLLYIIVGIALLLTHEKGELELWVNQRHTTFADFFFKYITNLGDGTFCLIMAALLLFVRFYYSLLALLPLLSGLITQIFKRTIYAEARRPKVFFSDQRESLNYVSGYNFDELSCCNSFPSGHTTTAFAIFLAFAFITRKSYWGGVFFLLAVLAAVSRVYLLQHFYVDTFFGALIGTSSMLVFYWILEKKRVSEIPFFQKKLF
ncbi:MAG TPA: phospholipid phosphatase [Microscillaceae bacterium]|nr:phospholipid phosphatase [Microscillaceae bacterium]